MSKPGLTWRCTLVSPHSGLNARLGKDPTGCGRSGSSSTPTLDAFLTSRFTDDSLHFSRHLASINRFDYLVDPARTQPFAHITPLPLGAALDLAVRNPTHTAGVR